jgi:hypothetical protein
MKRTLFLMAVVASLPPSGCSKKGHCDPEKIEAFFQLPSEKALGGARFICQYPRTLQTMLDQLDMASPDQRAAVVARAVSEDISQLERICHRAVWVVRDLAEEPEDHKVSSLIEGCELTSLGLASRSEMLRADLPDLLTAVMLYGWMQEKKTPQARKICRLILGLQD